MKKRIPLILLACLLFLLTIPQRSDAQCTVNITPTADTLCLGDSTTLTAAVPSGGSLLTTMAGGNNHRGNMFDLTAINTVTITQFDGNPIGTTGIEIYYRVGSFVGFENSSVGWTLIGSAANVVPIGSPTPTPFPIPINITIPGGSTYAFYVTSTNTAVSLNYTNGTTVGNVFSSDANLQFKEGKGMEYPFCNGGSPFSPRNWNGRIHYTVPAVSSYLWSNGATTNSIIVAPSATTTYTVTATSGTSCTASSTVSVGAAAVNLGADTSYCLPGSVSLNAGSGNNAYLWSNGATTQTITGLPGLNWASVTDAYGCTDADSIFITANTPPSVQLGNDTVLCGTAQLPLDAGNPGSNYDWSTGDSTQVAVILGSGTYDVTVRDVNGCFDSDTIAVGLSNASINLGADTTLCNAASTILDVGNGWASILWSNGSTNNFINVNATNTYSVTATDSVGCTANDSILVTASSNPIASFAVTGNTSCTQATVVNSSAQGVSYLWNWGDGNTSTGQNPAPHTYAQPFTGNITLTVTNPCGTNTLLVPFGCVGTSTADLVDLRIAPNPSNGHLQWSVQGLNASEMALTVLNLQGQEVYASLVTLTGNAYAGNLDLSHLAKGVYLLRLVTDEGQHTRRIVIE